MSSYVLNKYSGLSPPFRLTADDVNIETDSYRVTPRSIVSHRILREFSGTVSVQYLTSWNELEKTSRETEQDLEQYGNVVERHFFPLTGGCSEGLGAFRFFFKNAKYRAYRVQMAKRSQARSAGKVYVSPGHKLSCDPRCSPDTCSHDSIGLYIFLKTAGNGWQFAKMVEHGNICQRGERSGSRVSLLVRESAVAWSRFVTGAVTMMTRHPRALCSHTSGFFAEYIIWERSGSRGVARGSRGRSLPGRASRRAL